MCSTINIKGPVPAVFIGSSVCLIKKMIFYLKNKEIELCKMIYCTIGLFLFNVSFIELTGTICLVVQFLLKLELEY